MLINCGEKAQAYVYYYEVAAILKIVNAATLCNATTSALLTGYLIIIFINEM